MAARLMPVRVLYTLNNSQQYMLARTLNASSVLQIDSATPSITYGKTRLEICIQAINRSSPELLGDEEEDYSVYLLDPLESHQRNGVLTSTATSAPPQATGMAVGLGLLSTLSAPSPFDDIFVTGTISTGLNCIDSLEVVFNLREMKRKPRALAKQSKKRTASIKKQDTKSTSSSSSRNYSSSSQVGLHASTVINVQDRHRHYPPKVELYSSLPTDPGNFSHHPYQRSNSLPQLPIQPPLPHPSSSNIPQSVSNSSSQTPSLQTILSILSSAENTDAVLSMLSLIDAPKSSNFQSIQTPQASQRSQSPSTSSPTDPVFSEALRQLFLAAAAMPTSQHSNIISSVPHAPSTNNDLPTSSSTGCAPTPTPTPSTPSDSSRDTGSNSNGEVVVNKENVDPTTRSSPKNTDENKTCDRSGPPLSSPSRSYLSEKPPSVSAHGAADTVKRKRTLSEIMDEKDQQRDSARVSGGDERTKEKPTLDLDQVRKRLLYLSSQTQSDPNYGWNFNSFKSSGWATAKMKSARLMTAAGSEMTSVMTNDTGTKKRFVVPDWAKTDTATIPRLSEEAAARINAMAQERNSVVKPKSTKVKQSLGEKKRRVAPKFTKEQSEENFGHAHSEPVMECRKPTTPKRNANREISDFPLVARSSPAIFHSSPLALRSREPAMVLPPKTPKTPTRRRNSSPSRTPKRHNTRATSLSPLFTPGSGSCATPKLPSLFSSCSPLFSRGRSSPPEIARSSRRAGNEDDLLNSLPGASSDIEEDSPMKILSSSPPPSSPILTSSDDENPQLATDLPVSQKDRTAPIFSHDFGWLTTANACATSQPQTFNFDAAELMELVNGTMEGASSCTSTSGDLTNDAQLAAEIFSWTSADGSGGGDGFQLGEFWNSVKPLMEQDGGIGELRSDMKLANEVVDLFGGCLM